MYVVTCILGGMENDPDPTTLQYALWYVPTGTLLLATDARGEALRLEAALLAAGVPSTHFQLERAEVAASQGFPGAAPVLRTAFSKWL
jgi:hypothetical protein